MRISKRISTECSWWIPQLHRGRYSQDFYWSRKYKTIDADDESKDYVEMFASFGSGIEIDDSLINWFNRFVCHMYDWKGKDSVNERRYRIYCQSGAKTACEKLPTCKDVLQLHILRANYQAFIWWQQADNDPLQSGWYLDEEGCFDIKWMTCNPAPDGVTAFILKLSIKDNYFENASIDWINRQITLHQSTRLLKSKIIKIWL